MQSPSERTTLTSAIANFAPLLLAGTALGATLAFYLGWNYEEAYLGEWGLSITSFTYNPYEVMIRSSAIVLWSVGVPAGLLLGYLFGPNVKRAEVPAGRVLGSLITGLIVISVLASAVASVINDDWRPFMTTILVSLIVVAASLLEMFRRGSQTGRLLAGVVLATLLLIVLLAPQTLGSSDAKRDQADPDRLPLVSVTLTRSLGIDYEHKVAGKLVSGPWRLLRVNNGNLWLTPDEEDSGVVVQISREEATSITYWK